jgi:hypothetical protein
VKAFGGFAFDNNMGWQLPPIRIYGCHDCYVFSVAGDPRLQIGHAFPVREN